MCILKNIIFTIRRKIFLIANSECDIIGEYVVDFRETIFVYTLGILPVIVYNIKNFPRIHLIISAKAFNNNYKKKIV